MPLVSQGLRNVLRRLRSMTLTGKLELYNSLNVLRKESYAEFTLDLSRFPQSTCSDLKSRITMHSLFLGVLETLLKPREKIGKWSDRSFTINPLLVRQVKLLVKILSIRGSI